MLNTDYRGHGYAGVATFARQPLCTDIDHIDADVAVIGIPYENTMGYTGARLGPRGIREGSSGGYNEVVRGSWRLEQRDVYFGQPWRLVDCNDVPIAGSDVEPSFSYVRNWVTRAARSKALLVFLGGDHAITIPVVEAMSSRGPFGIVHIDAHLDWAGAEGREYGHESPLRRCSEMKHVLGMAQLGIRYSTFSAKEDYLDAERYGSVILTPRQLRQLGTGGVLAKIPKFDRYYVTIDIDGMDPSIAPGTGSTSDGGLLYDETRDLLEGIAGLGEIVGFDLVEVAPPLDPTHITGRLAARMILDFVGFILKEKERRGELPRR
jgi:agmatinase